MASFTIMDLIPVFSKCKGGGAVSFDKKQQTVYILAAVLKVYCGADGIFRFYRFLTITLNCG